MRSPRRPAEILRVIDGSGRPVEVRSGDRAPAGSKVVIETPQYRASVVTRGYVSGVLAGSLEDRKTGAHDLGFGLSIVDFLLEPAPSDAAIPPGQYEFGPRSAVHGNIPKRYVEGPQICTQAKELPATIYRGDGWAAVRLRYRWNVAYPPREKAGSLWEQTLVFPENERFFFSSDRVTTVSESPCLDYRVDMPGHIRHEKGRGSSHVYLSYNDPPLIPSTEFVADFPPDARFRYRKGEAPLPERFIRAYQVSLDRSDRGPWLAGMTLNPSDVYEAWCHQRGYVCLIEELGGRAAKPGNTFGAAYLVGWFDDPGAMKAVYDRYKGASGIDLEGPADRPTGFRLRKADELKAVAD